MVFIRIQRQITVTKLFEIQISVAVMMKWIKQRLYMHM